MQRERGLWPPTTKTLNFRSLRKLRAAMRCLQDNIATLRSCLLL